MSRLVHVQTQIQTVFGVLDGDGDLIQQPPITATIGKFSPDAFAEAQAMIAAERDKALANTENGGSRAQRRATTKAKS